MDRRGFLKLTGVAGASALLPAISLATSTKSIFDYHKAFELQVVYVNFEEDGMREYTLPLKAFESQHARESHFIYQYWPRGTHHRWENNSMVYVSKDVYHSTGWWTKEGFKDYMDETIAENYPNKNFHHSESGVVFWSDKSYQKSRKTYFK